jgi:hypothetical protein
MAHRFCGCGPGGLPIRPELPARYLAQQVVSRDYDTG